MCQRSTSRRHKHLASNVCRIGEYIHIYIFLRYIHFGKMSIGQVIMCKCYNYRCIVMCEFLCKPTIVGLLTCLFASPDVICFDIYIYILFIYSTGATSFMMTEWASAAIHASDSAMMSSRSRRLMCAALLTADLMLKTPSFSGVRAETFFSRDVAGPGLTSMSPADSNNKAYAKRRSGWPRLAWTEPNPWGGGDMANP